MADGTGRHIVVIGGGIVGMATAEALLAEGLRVTVLEPGTPGGTQAASYGNGAFLSPASVVPISMPGLWRKAPGYLMDRTGPMTIRWQYLPRLAGWLLKFLASGFTEARARRGSQALGRLLAGAPGLHGALAARIGAPELIRESGLLYLYHDRAGYEADGLAWRLRAECGVQMQEVEAEALARMAPGLSPRYRFGVLLTEGRSCADPGGYVAAIAKACAAAGAEIRSARAAGLRIEGGALRAVRLEDGAEIPCDGAVIAAGIGAKPLAAMGGDRVPLEAERGYHVEMTEVDVDLPIPVMPQDLKIAVIRTRTGLRAAGQVEFASAAAAPDWRRAEILRDALASCLPGLAADPKAKRVTRWQGCRPSTPDGLPVIGPASGCAGLWHAFGHGHIGLCSAPMTAGLVADMIAGRAPRIDAAAFSVARFR